MLVFTKQLKGVLSHFCLKNMFCCDPIIKSINVVYEQQIQKH